ncbi:Uncharacterized protein PECH_006952 [Penicillium ucsense]|uniref:Sigma-70 region 2 family protein n=1 Tax=Penicillium ucsense TaxID=2839758 RepID=A0A8J8W2P0_9EURO|nr:Uncharacterized protein PECM_005075 [Penicillium ucsense]KAF7738993.1 Uncharacterized protein PECH_006952 [Penicillium ucsense]
MASTNTDSDHLKTAQEAPSVRWQFIDASSNSRSNLTRVKRHVMQEYMRQKKGGSRNSESEDEQTHPVPPARRSKKSRTSTRRTTQRKSKTDEQRAQPTTSKKKQNKADTIDHTDSAEEVEEVCRNLPAESIRASSSSSSSSSVDDTLSMPLRNSVSSSYGSVKSSDDPAEVLLFPQENHPQDPYCSPSWSSSSPTSSLGFPRSPRTILSAARTDPFNSLPVELDLEGQQLFDFYVNEMPACSYGSHFRSPKAHNWYTRVFVPEAMKGAVAFQNTVLVHAANTWAWVRNLTETPHTLLHRDRALSMLRDHLTNNPHDTSDVAIVSCLSAAALEDFDPRPGHKEISWMHMRAAREMIRSRGGSVAFENTRLGMLINWQDYILSGYETPPRGNGFFFDQHPPPSPMLSKPQSLSTQSSYNNLHSLPSPPESTSSICSDLPACVEPSQAAGMMQGPSSVDEIRLQCEEFLDFLRRCEQLALYQRENPTACDLSRHTAIQSTSLLHRILVAPSGARFTASGDRKQMVARMTALMMLNAALWDYRYSPAQTRTFLCTLEQAMTDSEVSISGSVEAILQILLECNDGPRGTCAADAQVLVSPTCADSSSDFSQYSATATSPSARPWFVGRMLKIAKRLSPDSWHQVNNFFFSCLALQIRELGVCLWEPELRREILEAPSTSYIMPALY